RFRAKVDPIDFAARLLDERKRLHIERMRLDLGYSFRDIALTGKIMGATYAVSALLPARVVVRQEPRWESVDRWEFTLEGELRLWLGLLVYDALVYVLMTLLRRRPALSKRATETP